MINIGSARISVGDKDAVAIDCSCQLDPPELLAGVPTVNSLSADMVAENPQINTVPIWIRGTLVDAGKAIQFDVDATAARRNADYDIEFTFQTNMGRGPLGREITLRAK